MGSWSIEYCSGEIHFPAIIERVWYRFPKSSRFRKACAGHPNKESSFPAKVLTAFIFDVFAPAKAGTGWGLEILRHYFRLCYDLGLYNSLRYKDFAERLDEIGRMVGGWLRWLK
ncbi:MAG: four helix bundle protein [Saprospiraceae bacterium]|nr:four helix bundle protein [Saprospiraceae bacterium]